ncbi:fatty-acid--CoA ligase [Rhodococcus sp. SRB_17]|nr:fatty-acid--CoA ligase [Rhodococcus sp. SRB_17]
MFLTQFIHRALRESPGRPMTVFGDRTFTTAESVDRVARLASGLGSSRGDCVSLLALNSDRCHETILAGWWSGATVSPLNSRCSAAEIAYALNDSGSTSLIVDENSAPLVPELRELCPDLGRVVFCGSGTVPTGMIDYDKLIAESEPVPDLRIGDHAVALLLYTGGTTGRSKGVMVSHKGLMTSTLGTLAAGKPAVADGVNLLANPLFHIAGIASWMAQNMMGGTQVFLPVFSPQAMLEAIDRHRPTTVGVVPTMLHMLVTATDLDAYDRSSVQVVRYGASPISPALLERSMKAFPRSGFTQGYGMTETAHITVLSAADHLGGGDLLRSAGRALPHCEVQILDPAGNEVPSGIIGEIVTRGDHLMIGYRNLPEETAEAFAGGWMHTGDAGYLDERGYLFIVDRIKDMIITGGENVYSTEVENALSQHPAVAACSVVGVQDPKWGERVHAVVVLRPGAQADFDELRAHAKSLVSGYKAPRSIQFVDALPLSAAGKVLKRDLRDAAERGDVTQ